MTCKKLIMNRQISLKSKPQFIAALTTVLLLLSVSIVHGRGFFDTVGQSARPMGMGEVFIASSLSTSGYWYSPAGLSSYGKKQVDISYAQINPNIPSNPMKYQLSYVNPLSERSGFGVGISGLGVDGASEMTLSGAYGISLSENFAVGANVKIMRWSADLENDLYETQKKDDDLSKISPSLDLSATYKFGEIFGLTNMITGIYVKNAILPNIAKEDPKDDPDGGKLSPEIGIGLLGQKESTMMELDCAFVDGETIFHGGVETGITGSNLSLRGGFLFGSNFEDETERTDFDFGIGYVFSSLVFDYAFVFPLQIIESGGRHYVSFGVSF